MEQEMKSAYNSTFASGGLRASSQRGFRFGTPHKLTAEFIYSVIIFGKRNPAGTKK